MANYTPYEGNDIWAVPLAVTDFNVLVALLGGFILLFGLVSYLLKESYYLSEAREYKVSFSKLNLACPLRPLLPLGTLLCFAFSSSSFSSFPLPDLGAGTHGETVIAGTMPC